MIAIGDRVKLTKWVAQTMQANAHSKTDWINRRGVVKRRMRFRDAVFVLWDGRTSVEEWPSSTVELAEKKPAPEGAG